MCNVKENIIKNIHRIRLDSFEKKIVVNGLAEIRDRHLEGIAAEEIDDLILKIISAGEKDRRSSAGRKFLDEQ